MAAAATGDIDMPFLTKDDLKAGIRDYQLNAITDNDDSLVEQAIEAGIEEVSSALVPNEKIEWYQGQFIYDVAVIFSAEGDARNKLMVINTITVTLWHLIGLCNTGLEYKDAEGRYDRAIQYIEKLAAGEKNSATLPRITTPPPDDKEPFAMGGRRKFNHDY